MKKTLYFSAGNQAGVALLIVMAVIALLLASALGITRMAGRSALSIQYDNSRFLAREAALSGIHMAMMVLADDAAKTRIDSLQEDWAHPDKLKQMAASLGLNSGDRHASDLDLTIIDELGKLQVNALLTSYPGHRINPDQLRLWENYLILTQADDGMDKHLDPLALTNALKDWLDTGDDQAVTGLSGAESDHYQALSPGYACKNGPVDHLSEVLRIKGFTRPLVFGSAPDNSPFTVYGLSENAAGTGRFHYSGRININTAGVDLIAALLPVEMAHLAQTLAAHRQERSSDGTVYTNPLDKGWVTQVIDVSEDEQKWMNRMIRYDSHIFRIMCRAAVDNARVHLSAVVKRERQKQTNQWICRIIQLEEG
jgi:general secretion pathway protein K